MELQTQNNRSWKAKNHVFSQIALHDVKFGFYCAQNEEGCVFCVLCSYLKVDL